MATNYEEVLNAINRAAETAQAVSGTAGSVGAAVGNFVGNYQSAKAGEPTVNRPINDIQVGLTEETSGLVRVVIGAVAVLVGVAFLPKIFKTRKK